jgi:uncharacterized protein (TIGR03382 family)
LLLNGYPWVTVPGVAFEALGQPSANYTLTLPADVPDGIIDVQAAAYDDLGSVTTTPIVTMTKGAPCTTAATCAANQACHSGRCEYATPSANLGDACTYVQECATNMCVDGACTQACDIDDDSTCPEHFGCDGIGSDTAGICTRTSATPAGCCDAGGGGAPLHALLALLVLGAVTRRRATSSRS